VTLNATQILRYFHNERNQDTSPRKTASKGPQMNAHGCTGSCDGGLLMLEKIICEFSESLLRFSLLDN
jgi:hypothetical protein